MTPLRIDLLHEPDDAAGDELPVDREPVAARHAPLVAALAPALLLVAGCAGAARGLAPDDLAAYPATEVDVGETGLAPLPDAPALGPRPTLAALLGAARARSPALREAEAALAAARLGGGDALLSLLPTVAADLGYTGTSGRHHGFDFAGANGREEYVATAGLSVPLLRALSALAERDVARAAEEGAEADVDARGRDLALGVRIAYAEAVRAAEELQVLRALDGHLAELERYVARARGQGLAAELDANRAVLERIDVQRRVAAARAARRQALVDLASLVRADGIADVASPDDLVEPPGEVPAELEVRLLEAARARSPELARARADLARAGSSIDVAKAGYWPSIDATVTGGWDQASFPDHDHLGWSAGVSVHVPFFDWLRVGREVDRARHARDQARARLEGAELALARDLRSAVTARNLAAETLRRGLGALAAARRIVEQSRSGYEEGELSSLELLSAWSAATDAEVAVIQARADLRTAEARVARLCGLEE